MKRLLLTALALCTLGVQIQKAQGVAFDTYSACVECDCPKDCDCRKPGGTCPVSGPCSCDCPCKKDKFAEGPDFYVLPETREAIERNETLARATAGVEFARTPRLVEGVDYVTIKGVQQFTGYKPTWDTYRHAKFIRLGKTGIDLPKRFSAEDCGVSPVRGQLCGDCWGQGTISTVEYNISCGGERNADGSGKVFSVQDIIDNSGLGSCGGGDLAGAFLKAMGPVLEINYKYLGHNNGKHPNLPREDLKLKDVYFLRGIDGKWPSKEEVKTAMVQFGPALGICGSARSLGEGGKVLNPSSGSTNHCYSMFEWTEEDLFGVKNSWGDGDPSNPLANGRSWGDKGRGWYPWGKGSWVTEIQVMFRNPPMPKEPIIFSLKVPGATLKVTIPARAVFSRPQKALSDKLLAAFTD
jgi:hypothetical protein